MVLLDNLTIRVKERGKETHEGLLGENLQSFQMLLSMALLVEDLESWLSPMSVEKHLLSVYCFHFLIFQRKKFRYFIIINLLYL